MIGILITLTILTLAVFIAMWVLSPATDDSMGTFIAQAIFGFLFGIFLIASVCEIDTLKSSRVKASLINETSTRQYTAEEVQYGYDIILLRQDTTKQDTTK